VSMHEKDIKRIVKKQLKKNFPSWKRIPKKKKKALAKQVLEEVVRNYSWCPQIAVRLLTRRFGLSLNITNDKKIRNNKELPK
ncbi:MAG: hypothetical protein HY999_05580, partial [Nitrospinae bacterium]|nr:hypothetical protein [Nitrospinota bacterium]